MEDSRRFDKPRPFRSLDSWFTHKGFLRMVKEEWRDLGDVHFLKMMRALSIPLRRWNKQHFGDITERIKRFKEEIKKVDDVISSGRYDGTMEARRRALVRCCEKWYMRQDVHWKQMSRSWQANEMDRNTRYFHNIASARRRNNRIKSLIIHGRLVRNQARIKVAIRDFYKRLYHQEDSPCVTFKDGLVKQVEREEAEALKIGTEFTAAVMRFFEIAKLPEDSNVTWVALAPKFVGAKEIKDLDLSAWLEKMGFGRTWKSWIKECVRSASISILVNRSPSKPFKMERGLRQGDPLSPFLFVLVVDVLNRMIGETEEEIVKNYKRLLRCFEMMSGLNINFEKSSLILVNYSQEWVGRMCQLLGCQEANLPVKYLGISLGANPRLVKSWKPVIDMMEEKLSL
ncbi:uncharacterized protein [Arachis hypogaea]|uniref:uncharacterized protein n=1 Tax=Arachis hypogaea TaxID=3818 RepID=UPI003B21AB77